MAEDAIINKPVEERGDTVLASGEDEPTTIWPTSTSGPPDGAGAVTGPRLARVPWRGPRNHNMTVHFVLCR